MKFNKTLIAASLVSLTLAACGGAPKQIDSLEQARTAYDRAANDPSVARHAPKELDAAKSALAKADRAWREEEKVSRIDYQAGLASKRIKTAELIAKSREDGRQVEDMKLERQRVQLDLRANEIERSKQEADAARLETAKMQQDLEALKAQQTERGMVLTLGDVLFEVNESILTAGAARNIQQIAAFMKKYPERNAIIEGHTDSMGEDDYNMDLSRERAYAVREALALQGVPAHRIQTQGFGEAMPVASNTSSSGRQKNRRVEVIFPNAPEQVSELSN